MIFIYYKSKKLKGWVGMGGGAVDTIPSIPNKCLFVSTCLRTIGPLTPSGYHGDEVLRIRGMICIYAGSKHVLLCV